MSTFTATAYGKWILAGEHAVLRGVPALVFPILSRSMDLRFGSSIKPLELFLEGDHGKELQLLVWGVLEKACELKKINRYDLKGTLHLSSSIPVGAGMGASACLCVVITRWLGFLGYVNEPEFYDFARELENLFHGESSGVDIAVALSGEGLLFTRSGEGRKMSMNWQPNFYISYSGERGVTLDCVNQVKALIAEKPELGKKIDLEMNEAVEISLQALQQSQVQGFASLGKAIEIANQCFEQWGLNVPALRSHMQVLRAAGAVAVKPTGSGGGGYVLSLWPQDCLPAAELKLIRIFDCRSKPVPARA